MKRQIVQAPEDIGPVYWDMLENLQQFFPKVTAFKGTFVKDFREKNCIFWGPKLDKTITLFLGDLEMDINDEDTKIELFPEVMTEYA